MRYTFGIFGIVALIGLTNCNNKVKQCNDLIGVINKSTKEMKFDGNNDDPKVFKNAGDTFDKIAGDIAKVELKDSELKRLSKEYQDMVKQMSQSVRDAGAAMESKDTTKLASSLKSIEDVTKKEDPLVDGINKYCGAQ